MVEETPSLTRESSLESGARAEQLSSTVPSLAPPPQTAPQQTGLSRPSKYLRLCPLNIAGALRQRNMAQMKEEIKTPEKELSDEERDNLSDAEFKTLVIRMLTELVEFGCKLDEKK